MQNKPVRLGVNLDHVATLRQARGTSYPDLGQAIRLAESNGADGITLHLREDRRHIQDRDLELARECVSTSLNMEMAATDEMLGIALRVKPDCVCLVPERREELTTEGGLDVFTYASQVRKVCEALNEVAIQVSLFIEADRKMIDQAQFVGAGCVELHTGKYADAVGSAQAGEFNRLLDAARHTNELGLTLNAGHGLRRGNVRAVAELPLMHELNIGHSVVADAVFVGLPEAVRAMKSAMGG